MKSLFKLACVSVSAFLALPTWAYQEDSRTAWADVLEATPVRQVVRVPARQEVCWNEEIHRAAPVRRSATPRIVGAIIGGVIGNQFGGGSGRDVMTMAGAALGSSVAADQQNLKDPGRVYVTTERRCAIDTQWREEERIIGWDVTYEYRGEIYHARVPDAPGDRIRIRVDVRPVSE